MRLLRRSARVRSLPVHSGVRHPDRCVGYCCMCTQCILVLEWCAGAHVVSSPFYCNVDALICFLLLISLYFHFFIIVAVVPVLAVSCFFALGVNISNYLVLGKTSPLTYQVLGHLKTVLILVLGFTVFNVRFCLVQVH